MSFFALIAVSASMLALKNMTDPMVTYAFYAVIGAVYIYKNKTTAPKQGIRVSTAIGILAGVTVFLLNLVLTYVLSIFINTNGTDASAGQSFITAIIFTAIIPAICEELFFRGMLQTGFERLTDSRKAIIMTSFIFSVFHLPMIKIPAMIIAGLAFGYTYHRTNRLSASIAAHAVNNMLAVIMMYI